MARKLVDARLERTFVAAVPFYGQLDTTVSRLLNVVDTSDFEDLEARLYWSAIEALMAERGWFTLEQLLERCDRTKVQWAAFRDGVEQLTSRDEVHRHAVDIGKMAAERRLRLVGQSMLSLVDAGEMLPEDVVKLVQDQLLEVRSVVPEVPLPRTLRDAMSTPVARRFDWAVPDWLEVKDRIMITGREGGGKMTMIRQFLIQFAVGFHPWRGPDQFEPMVGLHVDLQDGQVRNEREFAEIAERSGTDPFDHLYLTSREGGINVVRSAADRRWLEGLIRTTRPHVIGLGPIYKMVAGEDRTDAVAMQVLIDFIERMRVKYDVIWILEAHAPKGDRSGRNQRSYDPFGSQVFQAWPDAGIGIVPDSRNPQRATLKDWRGNRDMLTKVWPRRVVYGDCWPWVPVDVSHPTLRHRPKIESLRPVDEPPPDYGGDEAF